MIRTVCTSLGIVLLCFSGGYSQEQPGTSAVAPSAAAVEGVPKRQPVPFSLRFGELDKMSLRGLADELGKTHRINRDGQTLLKLRASAQTYALREQLNVSRLAIKPSVQRLKDLFENEQFKTHFDAVRKLPQSTINVGYQRFLDNYQLQRGDFKDYSRWRESQKVVQRGKLLLARIEEHIELHELRGRSPVTRLTIRPSAPASMLDDIENSLEGLPQSDAEPSPQDGEDLSKFLNSLVD